MQEITINNGWNRQVLQILREEPNGDSVLKGNMISILTRPVELSYEWVLTYSKYQEPEFMLGYLTNKKGTFEVAPGYTNVDKIRKIVPGTPKLYVLKDKRVIMCSVHCHLHFTLLVINILMIVLKM